MWENSECAKNYAKVITYMYRLQRFQLFATYYPIDDWRSSGDTLQQKKTWLNLICALISINQHQSATISINQQLSASISIYQHQSALISFNQNQSASIKINHHQSESISINQHQAQLISTSQHQSAYQSASINIYN